MTSPGRPVDDLPELGARLHALVDGTPGSVAGPDEDLARARRSVRRRRLALGTGALAVVAVVGGVAWTGAALSNGDAVGDRAVASTPTASVSPTPAPAPAPLTQQQLLRRYTDVLAEHLDPQREHLQRRPDNVQGSGAGGKVAIGTKLGWRVAGDPGLGMVWVSVSDGLPLADEMDCASTSCRSITVDGTRARVQEDGGDVVVGVELADRTVVLGVSRLFGNNSLVPVRDLDVSAADLVRVAVDPRLVPPTREQAESGWPGHRL